MFSFGVRTGMVHVHYYCKLNMLCQGAEETNRCQAFGARWMRARKHEEFGMCLSRRGNRRYVLYNDVTRRQAKTHGEMQRSTMGSKQFEALDL